MSRYLVVTHQTALSPDLQRSVRALVAEDPAAEFAVLVPEAPGVPLTWEGETVDQDAARRDGAGASRPYCGWGARAVAGDHRRTARPPWLRYPRHLHLAAGYFPLAEVGPRAPS